MNNYVAININRKLRRKEYQMYKKLISIVFGLALIIPFIGTSIIDASDCCRCRRHCYLRPHVRHHCCRWYRDHRHCGNEAYFHHHDGHHAHYWHHRYYHPAHDRYGNIAPHEYPDVRRAARNIAGRRVYGRQVMMPNEMGPTI